MPERLRLIAGRLREFVGNRRRAPRFEALLPVVVSLLDARANSHPATAAGHTRDLSESGLGVVLPGIRIGDRYLAGEGLTLRVTLKLPGAHARLYGTPVRYERLEAEGQPGAGFLVGIRITEADDEDRRLLRDYLQKLKK
ncbi:MAG TPA: PilZ domain-containing protein [Pyrinomonadaceae bacterium]|nr:PilZ domain-containing protein [Pyrinomonadaceae bacterium]